MKWLDEPPCTGLKPQVTDLEAGRLELIGPALPQRLTGGFLAAFGATFGSVALPALRLPIPMPFKMIPLAFTVIGGGMSAVGMAAATAKVSVLIERGKGVRFRWKLGLMRQRETFIPVKEIAAFEVSRKVHHVHSDKHGSDTFTTYQLHLVTHAGKALALEEFGLQTQARLRQEQVETVLRLGQAKEKPRGRRRAAGRK